MECERVREEFVERLTGTLDPERSKAIDEHIAGCAECRAETARMREMWTELGSLRVPAAGGAGARVGRLIDARAGQTNAGTPARSRKSLAPGIAVSALAIAASLFAGVFVGQRTARDRAETPTVLAPDAPQKERYVLLLHGPARTIATTPEQAAADSATERALVAEYGAWAGQLAAAGSLVMGEKLADDQLTMLTASGTANVARFTSDEISGFFLIQAADSAEAYRIARDCPHLKHGGTVQLRRIEPT